MLFKNIYKSARKINGSTVASGATVELDLTDADEAAIARYDSWLIPAPAVADLADAEVDTPTTGQVLKYDTDHWENGTDATA